MLAEERKMAHEAVAEVYEEVVKRLSPPERLRLVERIAHDLSAVPPEGRVAPEGGYDWMALAGAAPNLLGGEDAQEWVSRTRRESDERRERQWKDAR